MNEELLIRFLTHTCLPGEIRQIEEWVASGKANADWLFEMERIWSLKDELHFSDKKEIEQAYTRFMSEQTNTAVPVTVPVSKRFRLYSAIKYVAVVLVVSLLSLNLYKLYTDESEQINIVEVPKGQRVNLTLSDGTKVWLNSQTKLIYPGRFSGKKREVKLDGEAFFEVMHNPAKPFIVDAALVHVKVLGTKFNMRIYPNEGAVVTLDEGKVEVETAAGDNKLTLKPHEQAVYIEESGMSLVKNIDPDVIRSWTKGEAAYVNKKLEDICRDLERKFDVKITITDPGLAADIFNSRFKETATIEQVLTLLKGTRRLEYSVDGQLIRIFKPKNNKPMDKH